ncbi:MAG TPA: hypothetical protein VF346_11025, partial [Bacteroidales bacterium]
MKTLYIIPTVHQEYPNYTSKDLSEIIEKIKPNVIFSELPMNWNEIIEKDVQEDNAINLLKLKIQFDVLNIDLPYRNEISEYLNLYKIGDLIESCITNDEYQTKKSLSLRSKLNKLVKEIYEP